MSILRRLSPRHLTSHLLLFHTRRLVTFSATAAAVSKDTTPWIPAPLSEIKPIAESLYHVSIDVSDSPDLAASHTLPGQYLQLRVPVVDRQTFLAIASPPSFATSRGAFEFLVKSVTGSTAELLCRLKRGDVVELSHAIGKGFAIDRIDPPEKHQAVLIFATGSGISPIRSLIESGFSADRRSDVRLYYGARNLKRMAYQDRFKDWESSGVKIIPVLSQPENSWRGEAGYVQAAYARSTKISNPAGAGAVLCGQRQMAEVGLYYEEALAALNVAPLKDHFDKAWVAHVQLKAALFFAEACYRYCLELHEKEEIAEEIARLRIAVSHLAEAKKNSKGAASQLLDAISKLEANINRNLERAVKENDRVYLMRVPSPHSLSPLPAVSLVKPMPMNDVLDASKVKMFASLVPDNSAKALSRYTEMVDDVIRTQAEQLQQGSELARVRLKEMDLPDSILVLEGSVALPQDLKEDVEAVQISGGPAGLEAELQQLKDLRRVNQELLIQTEELLQKEAAEDSQFRSQFGTRWTRPQSATLTKNLQDRLNRFAGNLKQAAESDARIERSVRENYGLMAILDKRPIESALPTLARPIMSLDANEDAIVRNLKQCLGQLENLGAQRAGLEDMLKEMKRKDDILPKLMTSTGSHDDLFRKEISKYDNICQDIAHNIEAQEQLLSHIQAENEKFSAVFNLEDYKASREKCYKQIQAAIAKYRETKDNINEGLKFYVTLQDAITNIKQQCSDFVMTRNIQCREMIEDVQRQMAGLSFQDRKNSGGPYNSYPMVNQSQRSSTQPPADPPNVQHSHPPQQPPPYYQPHEPTTTMPGYSHPPPPYNTSQPQPPPPYHIHPTPGAPYPPPHVQQQQPPQTGQEYGQPAYPGWRGPYYNSHPQQQQQQQGGMPRPPYTVPGPYPPYYK